MKKLSLAVAAMALAGSMSLAHAGDHGEKNCKGHHGKKHEMKMLEKFDADKDGAVTKDEMIAKITARFDAMDADKDGKVTPEEAKAYYHAKHADHGKKMEEKKADMPAEAPKAEEAAPAAEEKAAE